MLRKLHHIPLSQLTVSKLNVPKEIDSLAASIAALGIIQPLLVRRDGDGYEIVAGRRRYLAAKRLDGDGAPDAVKRPCVLLEANDDATAIEASLAENVERLPMDDLEQYEAFAALRKKGWARPTSPCTLAFPSRSSGGGWPSPTCIPTSVASIVPVTSTRRPCSC